MTDPITIRAALDLRPEDAIRAFRQRDELAVSYGWRDFEPEEHARAFTVANVFKLDLLAELGGSLDTALKEGQTFAQWRDGLSAEAQAFRTSRLQTIFRTNMRVSRAAGQWARIQAVKSARPFLRYSAVLDSRTRPLHARWHAIIRPVDDPIWQTIFPPNGFNCRCQVQQLSQRDLDRRGWVVTPDADLPQLDPIGETLMGGRIRPVIKGVDEGWDYNPGAQSFAGLVARAAEVLAKAQAAGLNLAAAEVRDAIVTELEAVLGRTLALALLAQLAPAAVQIEAAAKGGKKGGKAKGGSAPRRSGFRPDQKRDPGGSGRWVDEGKRTKREDLRLAHTRQWVEDTIAPGATHHGNLPLGRLTGAARARMEAADMPPKGDVLALAPNHTIHMMREHGTPHETRRGQLPITADDLHNAPRLINAAQNWTRSLKYRNQRSTDAPRGTALVQMDGHEFELLVEQQRIGPMLRDMWKWKL